MTKNTKNILMVGGVAIVGYLLYKKYSKKSKSSTSSFSGDEGFFNFTKSSSASTMGKSKSCRLVDGSVNVGSLPFRLGNGDYIISTSQIGGTSGNGQTLICPEIPRGGVYGVVL
jgi:hypothetical protein